MTKLIVGMTGAGLFNPAVIAVALDGVPDAPGAIGQSAGYSGRVAYDEPDYHQLEEDNWVKDAADELKRRALRNDYDALVLVAPPKALGVLRKQLHKEVERRVILTINKEMTDKPIPDIEELLVAEAAPAAVGEFEHGRHTCGRLDPLLPVDPELIGFAGGGALHQFQLFDEALAVLRGIWTTDDFVYDQKPIDAIYDRIKAVTGDAVSTDAARP